VVVPEWLSGMTRNHVGSARAGSNPADHAFFDLFFFFGKKQHFTPRNQKEVESCGKKAFHSSHPKRDEESYASGSVVD
jgi:hypothetical protein